MMSQSSASGCRPDDAEADRAAVVLHEQAVVVEALEGEEPLDDLGELVERVPERGRVGRVAVSEARIVGRDDVERVGQRADQVAVLVRRGRKPWSSTSFGLEGSPASRYAMFSPSTSIVPKVTGAGGFTFERCDAGFVSDALARGEVDIRILQ